MGGARRAVGGGRWAMDDGRWALGDGRRALGVGRWALGASACVVCFPFTVLFKQFIQTKAKEHDPWELSILFVLNPRSEVKTELFITELHPVTLTRLALEMSSTNKDKDNDNVFTYNDKEATLIVLGEPEWKTRLSSKRRNESFASDLFTAVKRSTAGKELNCFAKGDVTTSQFRDFVTRVERSFRTTYKAMSATGNKVRSVCNAYSASLKSARPTMFVLQAPRQFDLKLYNLGCAAFLDKIREEAALTTKNSYLPLPGECDICSS